jgi:hypothetical protein
MSGIKKTCTGFITIIMVGIFPSYLGALEFEDYGYDVVERRVEDGIEQYRVRDTDGREIIFGAVGSLDTETLEVMERFMTALRQFQHLDADSVKIVYIDGRYDILVFPSRFEYDGEDILPLVPSGIQFYYSEFLEYDFRLFVSNLFVRMQGQFVNEEIFMERVVRAARNPEQYIQSQDPAFMLERINDLEQIALRLQDVTRSQQREMETLTRELDRLRFGSIVLSNRGFFGGLRGPDRELVDAVVAVKTENPEFTQEQVRDHLAARGINAGSREILLIFSVYYNEFEQ